MMSCQILRNEDIMTSLEVVINTNTFRMSHLTLMHFLVETATAMGSLISILTKCLMMTSLGISVPTWTKVSYSNSDKAIIIVCISGFFQGGSDSVINSDMFGGFAESAFHFEEHTSFSSSKDCCIIMHHVKTSLDLYRKPILQNSHKEEWQHYFYHNNMYMSYPKFNNQVTSSSAN